MKTITIILAMLAHHADDFTHDIAAGIDAVCESDTCRLDAIATCWVETRCRGIDKCNGACGPFQQIRKYSSHPELEGLSYEEKGRILGRDTVVATEQWKLKRDKLKARFRKRWPKHQYGGKRKVVYIERWNKARRWAEWIKKAESRPCATKFHRTIGRCTWC